MDAIVPLRPPFRESAPCNAHENVPSKAPCRRPIIKTLPTGQKSSYNSGVHMPGNPDSDFLNWIDGRIRIVCGRYVVKSPSAKLNVKFHLDDAPLFEPRYNVAPTQLVPAMRQEDGKRRLVTLRWGLIPSWAKDAKIGFRLINARADTVATKPSFRSAFKRRQRRQHHAGLSREPTWRSWRPGTLATGTAQSRRSNRTPRIVVSHSGDRWGNVLSGVAVRPQTPRCNERTTSPLEEQPDRG
jgi:hypothetical protein